MATRSATRSHCRPKWLCKPPRWEVRQARSEVKRKLCRNFVKQGNCHYGDRCKFQHQTYAEAWSRFEKGGIILDESDNPLSWELTDEDIEYNREMLLTDDEAADAEREDDAGDRNKHHE